MTTSNLNLIALNTFRAIDGLAPFADFRKARHASMLNDYEAVYDASAVALNKQATKQAKATKQSKATEVKAPRVTYKSMPHYVPTPFVGAVAFVHGFLNANPDLTRKQAVETLVNVHQVNFSTARTQYQRWASNRKAATVAE